MKLNIDKKKLVVPGLIVIIIVLVLILVIPNKKGKIKTTLKSSIDKVVEKSDLETANITYNIIAKKCKKDGCDTSSNDTSLFEYVLSCDASITAGIDFSKVDIDIEGKKVIVKLPDATLVGEPNIGSVKALNGKEIKATEYADARKFCQEEVKERALNDNKLLPAAKEQSKTVLEDFYKSWINIYDSSYKIEFK